MTSIEGQLASVDAPAKTIVVKTAAGKKRAVALAQGVDGVKKVVDQTTIGG